MSKLDELNNDRKNLKKLVELSEKMRDALSALNTFDERGKGKINESIELLRDAFVRQHNEVIQQIAIEQHGIQ